MRLPKVAYAYPNNGITQTRIIARVTKPANEKSIEVPNKPTSGWILSVNETMLNSQYIWNGARDLSYCIISDNLILNRMVLVVVNSRMIMVSENHPSYIQLLDSKKVEYDEGDYLTVTVRSKAVGDFQYLGSYHHFKSEPIWCSGNKINSLGKKNITHPRVKLVNNIKTNQLMELGRNNTVIESQPVSKEFTKSEVLQDETTSQGVTRIYYTDKSLVSEHIEVFDTLEEAKSKVDELLGFSLSLYALSTSRTISLITQCGKAINFLSTNRVFGQFNEIDNDITEFLNKYSNEKTGFTMETRAASYFTDGYFISLWSPNIPNFVCSTDITNMMNYGFKFKIRLAKLRHNNKDYYRVV